MDDEIPFGGSPEMLYAWLSEVCREAGDHLRENMPGEYVRLLTLVDHTLGPEPTPQTGAMAMAVVAQTFVKENSGRGALPSELLAQLVTACAGMVLALMKETT